MEVDFGAVRSRINTRSIKWDYVDEGGQLLPRLDAREPLQQGALLSLGLSDMDSPAPQPVRGALMARVEHGIFGYTMVDDGYYKAIINWMAQRHGWAVEREWIITTSGIMQSINLLIQTLTQAGEGIIIQPPVFGPIAHAVTNNGRVIRPFALLRLYLAGPR